MEHNRHERDIQPECTSRHDECVEASRKEAAEANDKWGKKVAKLFGKLSTKVKIALVVVIAVALVGFFGFILPSMLDNDGKNEITNTARAHNVKESCAGWRGSFRGEGFEAESDLRTRPGAVKGCGEEAHRRQNETTKR